MVEKQYSVNISFIPSTAFLPSGFVVLTHTVFFAYLWFPSRCATCCLKMFWISGPWCVPVRTSSFDGGAVQLYRRWLQWMEAGPYITEVHIIIIAQKMKLEAVWDWNCSCASLLFTSSTSISCTLWNKILVIPMFYMEHYYIIYSFNLPYILYVISSSTAFL